MAENVEFQMVRASTRRLLEGQEGREVDFKQAPGGVEPADLVAFANGTGGTILVGVEEVETESGLQRGQVVGCAISDEVRVGFVNKASSCRPPVELMIAVENLNDTPFYRIDIPEGSHKPYCTQRGIYTIRSDGRNLAIDPDMMAALILERETEQFVNRFRSAADKVIDNLGRMEKRLEEKLSAVEAAADRAASSAEGAIRAAEAATGAAEEAAAAAEDAAYGEEGYGF